MIFQTNVVSGKPLVLRAIIAMKTDDAKLIEAGTPAIIALQSDPTSAAERALLAFSRSEFEHLFEQIKTVRRQLDVAEKKK